MKCKTAGCGAINRCRIQVAPHQPEGGVEGADEGFVVVVLGMVVRFDELLKKLLIII